MTSSMFIGFIMQHIFLTPWKENCFEIGFQPLSLIQIFKSWSDLRSSCGGCIYSRALSLSQHKGLRCELSQHIGSFFPGSMWGPVKPQILRLFRSKSVVNSNDVLWGHGYLLDYGIFFSSTFTWSLCVVAVHLAHDVTGVLQLEGFQTSNFC